VTVSHWGFDGRVHTGRLIVAARGAPAIVRALRALYDARFPIRRMKLVERYGSDDDRSMAADNTSAFNCRLVEGSTSWSAHAYGLAIDINPLENPYLRGGQVLPPAGRAYLDRRRWRTGMIHAGDKVVRAFAAVGWSWGGAWHSPVDYQHFSATGG
jgi:poly-gamma-glutamate synthesis protein (capsule biosynthesis protein)